MMMRLERLSLLILIIAFVYSVDSRSPAGVGGLPVGQESVNSAKATLLDNFVVSPLNLSRTSKDETGTSSACYEDPDHGRRRCEGERPRRMWYYSVKKSRCKRFVRLECSGRRANKFQSLRQCQRECEDGHSRDRYDGDRPGRDRYDGDRPGRDRYDGDRRGRDRYDDDRHGRDRSDDDQQGGDGYDDDRQGGDGYDDDRQEGDGYDDDRQGGDGYDDDQQGGDGYDDDQQGGDGYDDDRHGHDRHDGDSDGIRVEEDGTYRHGESRGRRRGGRRRGGSRRAED